MSGRQRVSTFVLVVGLVVTGNLYGQGGASQVPQAPKTAAPFDIAGYWVSVITEDWRYRMLTPPKGDFLGVPVNAESRKVANGWDPAKDEAAGEQCKGYGAPGIMRLPGRIHVTWKDDQTLKLETDTGMQTRTFSFAAPQGEAGSWQGVSQASWDFLPGMGRSRDGADPNDGLGGRPSGPPLTCDMRSSGCGGSLKVVTTKLKPGYLRKNGIPYSANATLTEYYDRLNEPNGDTYLMITLMIEDPTYLSQPYLTVAHYKKQADATGWNPTPCSTR